MPSDHVGVLALGAIPLSRPSVAERDAGERRPRRSSSPAWARATSSPRAPAAGRPTLDIGLAAVWLRSAGTANAGFVGGRRATSTAARAARLGLALAVTPLFRLRADVLTGVITQGTSIQLATHEVATWGQPFVLPSAGVDFGWF